MRPENARRAFVLVATACTLIATPGCGSNSTSDSPQANAKPRPAVAARVVRGDSFFGFPAISGREVRTDPGELSADLEGFYADPEKAVADLRRDGFVAGVGRIF